MYITIMRPGPQISNTGVFSHSFMYFYKYLRRENTPIEGVKKVVFHVYTSDSFCRKRATHTAKYTQDVINSIKRK